MKKMLFVLIAIAFVSSLCFAEEPAVKADEVKTFTGKIESVRKLMGKPPKWTHAEFTVLADSGEKMIIYVIKATVVTDASGKDMNEGGKKLGALLLKKGERIEVKYSTELEYGVGISFAKKDRNEATSIRCLE